MATEIKKPTTFTEGALLLWTNESNAYDQSGTGGDETTYAYQSLDTDESPSIRFHTWETKGQTYTATILKLKWQTSIQTGDDEVHIEYTKNGGSNWYDLLAKGVNRSVGFSTAQISLDANQDLTQVRVRVSSDKVKGADGCDFRISDIWTEGTYTGATIKTVSDAGNGADAIAGIAVSLSVADTGQGVDQTSESVDLSVSDVGSGSDALAQLLASLTAQDSGSGTDAISQILADLSISDTGQGSDSISQVTVNFVVADTGQGVDVAPGITVALAVSDSGSGADAIDVLTAVLKSVSDSGGGIDAISSIQVSVPVADSGQGIDAVAAISALLNIADAGTGIDGLTIAVDLAISDAGAGADSVSSISVTVPVADTAQGIDLIAAVSALISVSVRRQGLIS